jgi:hypothetical protein
VQRGGHLLARGVVEEPHTHDERSRFALGQLARRHGDHGTRHQVAIGHGDLRRLRRDCHQQLRRQLRWQCARRRLGDLLPARPVYTDIDAQHQPTGTGPGCTPPIVRVLGWSCWRVGVLAGVHERGHQRGQH